jgi:DNA-directed RNA polymerase subunit F
MASEKKLDLVTAAKELRKAMKGIGTDEAALIKNIVPFNNNELQQLIEIYRKEIQRDLIPDIKSETSGNFRKCILSLLTAWDTYDSHLVREAIEGLGTNEKLLTEVICTRTPDELKAIAKKYEGEYQKDILKDIKGDTSGDYQKVLFACFGDGRKGGVDKAKVAKDVEALYNAGEKKLGTDEDTFIKLIAGQPRAHVEVVALEYGMKYGKHFSSVISSEMSGPLKYALQVLSTPLPQFFAEQFNAAMKGAGTNDDKLIRTLCSSYHRCLREVTVQYLTQYKVNLKNAFADETSGDYKKILTAICDVYTAKSS